VTGRGAETAPDWVEAAQGRCDSRALDVLWAAVPEGMRLSRFAESSVPAQYAGAFCHDGTWRAGVDLSCLPEPMLREVAWCVFRIIELGGKIPTPTLSMLVRRLGEVLTDRAGQAPASLLGLSGRDWCQAIQHAAHRRAGRLPAASTMNNIRQLLARMMRLLVTAVDTGPWWHRDQWNPVEDTRIPLRDHEPMGRYSVRFDRIDTRWLRRGLQWHCKVGLDTGVLSWSTVHRRVVAVKEFDRFLLGRQVDGPALAEHAAGVRALMLEFLGHLRARQLTRGRHIGRRLSPASVQRLASDVEQFYLFMADNKDAASAALAEPGWLRLGPQHTGFYRRGELPGKQQPRLEGQVIDDDALTQIMAGLDLLGAPVADGGFGDEQAMRITMLVALLGRRISEICLLDPDPLQPLLPATARPAAERPEPGGDGATQASVAKLRYQQTKIDGAPNTILVHAEVVAIIREQQQWAQRYFAEHGAPGTTPKYLFLAAQMNRNGDRPYSDNVLRSLLTELATRLDVRDSTGALVDFNRTHRFRHTVATSLLNTGVPLHVVQRYLGHLTPTMSMTYAQTLQSTAEREFLRYRKITADARDLEIDPRDLYDMLALDRRTDRILPNGWCLLPPRQSCHKGNACLTCDKFATDATFLPELRTQQARTGQLIDDRRTAFEARTGQQMSEDNIWLAGRRQEHDALGRIILKLEHTRLADGTVRAVRGAGVDARIDARTDARIDAITGEQGPR
jgi:integrase